MDFLSFLVWEWMFIWIGWLVIWLVVSVVIGVLASKRGRSGFGWFLLAFIISPLLAGLLLALIENLAPQQSQPETRFLTPVSADTKACPRCAETIKKAATVCRFCGYVFPEHSSTAPTPSALPATSAESIRPNQNIESEALSLPRCEDCGATLSPLRKTCPNCSTKSYGPLIAAVFAIVLLVGGIFWLRHIEDSGVDTSSATADSASTSETASTETSGQQVIVVSMAVRVTSANPLIIVGTTNLPTGTDLSLIVNGDLPACIPRCGFGSVSTKVRDGRFIFRIAVDQPLIPDAYMADIVTPSIQPLAVRAILGAAGEHLRGPYLAALNSSGHYVSIDPSMADPKDYLSGFLIHYTHRFSIVPTTSSGQPTPAPSSQPSPVSTASNISTVQGSFSTSQAEAASEAQPTPVQVATKFFEALQRGDGSAASTFVVPERRQEGPLSASELNACYAALQAPLHIAQIWPGAKDAVYAHYSFTNSAGHACLASAAVRLVSRGSELLIDAMNVNENCR
jgi:RNA polymerase subunit RPABC4/transcription elongation factor Spt4